jgi:uncharacterized protein
MFEWDEDKNRINVVKHDLDFVLVRDFAWHDAVLYDRSRVDDGEQRYAAIGAFNGQLHTVIFTRRGKQTRIISFRRSNRAEEKTYEENS